MIRHSIRFLPLFLAVAAAAQTTGIPGQNDLQVAMPPSLGFPVGSNPVNGGSLSSCANVGLHSPVNAGWLHYQVSVNGTTSGAIMVFGFCGCGGSSAIPFLPPSGVGCAGPTAGTPLTNLWLSVNVAPGCFVTVGPTAVSPGFYHWRIPVPAATPFGFTLWAQAVLIDLPCGTVPFKFSQAVGIS